MNKLTKEQINEKMELATKQGYVYVSDIDNEIIKVSLNGWNKKNIDVSTLKLIVD